MERRMKKARHDAAYQMDEAHGCRRRWRCRQSSGVSGRNPSGWSWSVVRATRRRPTDRMTDAAVKGKDKTMDWLFKVKVRTRDFSLEVKARTMDSLLKVKVRIRNFNLKVMDKPRTCFSRSRSGQVVDDPRTAGRPDFLAGGDLNRPAGDVASRRTGGRRVTRHSAPITATLPRQRRRRRHLTAAAACSAVHWNNTPVNN